MDYQVAFFQDSWEIESPTRTKDVVEAVINTRDAVIRKLRLPGEQEGKVDSISCGIWLKVRTDRPRPAQTTTAFVSVQDKGLHRPVPFSYMRTAIAKTQIRLLELFPGAPQDPLRGRLRVVSLDKAPSYHALSYIWGSPGASVSIALGSSSFASERITRSLQGALCELRRLSVSRLLWVDALCINQSDDEEKSHQVQIMGTIFASATEVVVYLGKATEDSHYGMQVLQYLAEGKGFEERPPWEAQPPELVQRGLYDILGRQWFHRIWTVQEAALSSQKTVMICEGGSSVEWPATTRSVSMFIRGLKFAAVTADWRENGFAGAEDLGLSGVDLTGMINLLGQQLQQIQRRSGLPAIGLEPDLLDIAYEVKDKKSHDPRDRLFAILGLALIRGANVQLQPDYSKPLREVQEEFRQILLDATTGNVETTGRSGTTERLGSAWNPFHRR